MTTPRIGIVLTAAEPQQVGEITELLGRELEQRAPGAACIVAAPPGGGSAREAAERILAALEKNGLIGPPADAPVYSPEEEEKIRRRLEDLGYL